MCKNQLRIKVLINDEFPTEEKKGVRERLSRQSARQGVEQPAGTDRWHPHQPFTAKMSPPPNHCPLPTLPHLLPHPDHHQDSPMPGSSRTSLSIPWQSCVPALLQLRGVWGLTELTALQCLLPCQKQVPLTRTFTDEIPPLGT